MLRWQNATEERGEYLETTHDATKTDTEEESEEDEWYDAEEYYDRCYHVTYR